MTAERILMDVAPSTPAGSPASPASSRRPADLGAVPVFRRSSLPTGQGSPGAAVVEDGMSTLVVPPGAVATLEAGGNLVVELRA